MTSSATSGARQCCRCGKTITNYCWPQGTPVVILSYANGGGTNGVGELSGYGDIIAHTPHPNLRRCARALLPASPGLPLSQSKPGFIT
jgi:hypothetical protein